MARFQAVDHDEFQQWYEFASAVMLRSIPGSLPMPVGAFVSMTREMTWMALTEACGGLLATDEALDAVDSVMANLEPTLFSTPWHAFVITR